MITPPDVPGVCETLQPLQQIRPCAKSVMYNTLFNLYNSSLYFHLSSKETEAERSYLLDSHNQ